METPESRAASAARKAEAIARNEANAWDRAAKNLEDFAAKRTKAGQLVEAESFKRAAEQVRQGIARKSGESPVHFITAAFEDASKAERKARNQAKAPDRTAKNLESQAAKPATTPAKPSTPSAQTAKPRLTVRAELIASRVLTPEKSSTLHDKLAASAQKRGDTAMAEKHRALAEKSRAKAEPKTTAPTAKWTSGQVQAVRAKLDETALKGRMRLEKPEVRKQANADRKIPAAAEAKMRERLAELKANPALLANLKARAKGR